MKNSFKRFFKDRHLHNRSGFTLIELLVVIAVIAVLAAVILASLSDARKKSQYTKVVSDFQEMEKAFNLLYHDYGCWPRENASTGCTFGSASNPSIASLVAGSSGLGNYLSQAPIFPFPTDAYNYRYDNDGNVHDPITCNTATAADTGVNLYVKTDIDTYEALNTIVDKDPNPAASKAKYCGKIRWDGSIMLFNLSNTQ